MAVLQTNQDKAKGVIDHLGGKINTVQKPQKINLNAANSAVSKSGGDFLGMINKNVVQPAKNMLGYPGQVIAGTVNQAASGLESLGGALKGRIEKENPSYFDGFGGLGEETPSQDQINQSLGKTTTEQGQLEPAIGSQPMPTVNLAETATKQPGYVSPEGVAGIKRATEIMDNRQGAADSQEPALGNNYYAETDINPAFEKGIGGFNEMDKSKLVDENGFPAYADGQQVSAPLFDNTYMKKRYGEDVEKPRTEEERVTEGTAVNERRDKYLSSLGGKGTIREQQLGLAREQYSDKKQSDASSAAALGEQNRFANELATRKQKVEEYKASKPEFEQMKIESTDQFGNKTNSFGGAFNPATGKGTMLGGEQAGVKDIKDMSKEDKLALINMMTKAPDNPVVMKGVNDYLSQFELDYDSFLAQQTKR